VSTVTKILLAGDYELRELLGESPPLLTNVTFTVTTGGEDCEAHAAVSANARTSRAAPDARRHASAGDVGERAPAGGI
jgi:hypothetical protein